MTWSADSLARAVTALTLHSHDHYSLVESHVSSALATVTFLGFSAWFGFRSMAGMASTSAFVLNVLVYRNYTLEVPCTASANYKSHLTMISSVKS